MNLNGIELPPGYSGVGLHDTPGTDAAAWGYDDAKAHAALLRAHGVTTYKLLTAGSSKLQRARAYVEAGIVPVVRFYQDKPWGRGSYWWVTPRDQAQPFYDVGVRLFETAGNEANIDCEWVNGINGQTAKTVAVECVNAWEVGLGLGAQLPGAKVLLSSMTPGGNIDHRAVYAEVVNELVRRGLQSSCEHIAAHIRSHNVPPSFKLADNPSMTISWAEQFWIVDKFAAGGMHPYLWSTEFGPAPFDDPPTGYGQLSYEDWVEYAWEEFRQMDPAHVYPASPQLAGIHHWYEAAWGHPGAWTKDSLRDSQDTRVPAPTALWTRMEERAADLAFEKYGGEEPPEPPSETEDGIDISWYQRSGMDWEEVAEHNQFCYIRASYGLTLDAAVFGHSDQAQYHAPDVKLGYYHYLRPDYNPTTQGRFFANLAWDLPGDLTPAVDVEAVGLTAADVRAFVEAFEAYYYTSPVIYTRAQFWDTFTGLEDIAARCPLWVAHWRVEEPDIPRGWSDWTIWQYDIVQGPEHPNRIDRNRRKTGEEPEPPDPPDPPDSLRILDASGQLRDWAWLTAEFGLTESNVEQGDAWRVTQLQEGGEEAAIVVYGPPGTVVQFGWPDGFDEAPIKPEGHVGFPMGPGAYYWPPAVGPHYVTVGDCIVTGLGMIGGTNHRHVNVTVAAV